MSEYQQKSKESTVLGRHFAGQPGTGRYTKNQRDVLDKISPGKYEWDDATQQGDACAMYVLVKVDGHPLSSPPQTEGACN